MLSRAEARRIEALQQRKNRAREGLFVAEGVRVVEELLTSGIVPRYVVAAPSIEDNDRGRALLARAAQQTRVLHASDAELRRLAGTETPQGVLAVAETPVHTLGQLVLGERALLLLLDAVQDPGNLGTLVRTADAFAVAGVIALPGTVDCWNPKVVRAAAGSLFRTHVVYATPETTRSWLESQRVRACAADADGTDARAVVHSGRTAIIVGNEGAGLSAEARALAAEIVAIRMPGNVESLNVAVAAGILMYEFTRTSP